MEDGNKIFLKIGAALCSVALIVAYVGQMDELFGIALLLITVIALI